MMWWAGAYLAVGTILALSIGKSIQAKRPWIWQDNVMSVVVVLTWPVFLTLAVIVGGLSRR